MDKRSTACAELVERLIVDGAYKSTKFIYGENLTVKATRKRYNKKILKNGSIEIIITIGKPNYEEREALKKAKKENTILTFRSKFPKAG
jgi:hypothetical protein